MELKEFLDKNLIEIDTKVSNKLEALKHMSNVLEKFGYVKNSDQFLEDVLNRESLGETGIGDYIAITHGQSSSVNKTTLAIMKLHKEIEWETIDHKGIRLIILFVVANSENYAKEHLTLLSEVARKLANDEVKELLIEAKNSNDIIEVLAS